MPLRAAYSEADKRLELSFEGNLDVTVSQGVCDACLQATAGLRSCTLDLTDVERVFDSGVALLHMLSRRLSDAGIPMVVLGGDPRILEAIPTHCRPAGQPPAIGT